MNRSVHYNTKQKSVLLNTIKNKNNVFTIKDLYNEFNGEIGLTTIYRLVDKLVSDKVLDKQIDENNTTYYQYLEECKLENHFYLRCSKCGHIEHVDCDCINELYDHIINKHNFKLNKEKIIINGICEKCVKDVILC